MRRRACSHARRTGRDLAAIGPLFHPDIDLVDYLIAATARSVRADLVTLNVKHFPMFKGLEAPYAG